MYIYFCIVYFVYITCGYFREYLDKNNKKSGEEEEELQLYRSYFSLDTLLCNLAFKNNIEINKIFSYVWS